MPCTYYLPGEEQALLSEEVSKLREQLKTYKKELDLATRVACKLSKKVKEKKIIIRDSEIKKWMAKHEKQDVLRLAKEKE